MGGTVKALSVKQPWLDWVLAGRKTIETRTWTTPYRGPLLLVASKSVDAAAALADAQERGGGQVYVTGKALAVVDLVDVRDMTADDVPAALCDVTPGRKAWVLGRVARVVPTPVRGQLGLYDVPLQPDVAAILENWGRA